MTKPMIDLSHRIKDGLVTYPGLPSPCISAYMNRADSADHYSGDTQFHIGRIDMIANTGTYIDAPYHRFAGQADIAGLALRQVANLPGVCIDVSGASKIQASHLNGYEVAGRAVLLCTGWSRHFGTERYGIDHPFLTSEAAEMLVDSGALLVGIDSLNIDDAEDGFRPAHTRLLAAGIPIVEHLCALRELVGKDFRMFAVPAPVEGMGSFPVRAFAILGDEL